LLKGEIDLNTSSGAGFIFAILVILLSPLLVWYSQRCKRWAWSFLPLLVSALYLTYFATNYKFAVMFAVSGYYAWVMSFWLVAAGILKLRAESLYKAKGEKPSTSPSQEEMAAECELKDYLR
jgi:hypothetical protein